MALHQVIWTRCALQCPLCPTFPLSVPPLMVIWSYLEQGYNSATGHSVWLVRSPGTVYHLTFVRHIHYQRSKWCSRHICFLDPTSVTNCRPEYEQRILCGALVVTLAMLLLRLINCRFIIIIIPIVMTDTAAVHVCESGCLVFDTAQCTGWLKKLAIVDLSLLNRSKTCCQWRYSFH